MPMFVVQAQGHDIAAVERARFVPDRFSWPAFILAYVWLLYHRLWLALIVWIVFEAAFVVLVLPHVGTATALLVDAIARLFLGLEGNRLRLSKGAKNAKLTDVVEARDRDEAETSFFRTHALTAVEPVNNAPAASQTPSETTPSRASDEVAPAEPKA